MTPIDPVRLLPEQIAFYRADAGALDAWYAEVLVGGGGGDFGAAFREDRARALAALRHFAPRGAVLELAAGTGAWTPVLLESADHVTAVDASPESLAIARRKPAGASGRVTFIEADLFAWRPQRRYDMVFFAYWLSHVPISRFDSFWELLRDCIAENGRVFFVDSAGARAASAAGPGSARYRERDDLERQVSVRVLEGRRYHVVKVAWEPDPLERRLAASGWQASVERGLVSIWGSAVPIDESPISGARLNPSARSGSRGRRAARRSWPSRRRRAR